MYRGVAAIKENLSLTMEGAGGGNSWGKIAFNYKSETYWTTGTNIKIFH